MSSPCCSIDTEPSGAVGASDLEKTMTNTPITAGHTIGEWLEHPTGGPAIREMLAASGTDEGALGPALTMPLQQLVALSGGQMPQSVVD